ncbi:Cytosolic enolase 3 [Sesamum angolense]|uniref:phosphopyruvate hydratase n=1 Tax=Sesamum angolense TaxID=2727404 RepID=A0AAE1XBI8_9LAMI|nr:Cytosolic enolase 3 [Sesamum angolense]
MLVTICQFSLKEGLDFVKEAIARTGYNEKIKIAIGVGATEFCIAYPIVSIEDPFDKEDWEHSKYFSSLGICQVVGDDLLTSNAKRIERAVQEAACNALLLKINQVGTVTETIEVTKLAKDANWGVVISQRSGESEDSFLADLAVGLATGQIKAGAPCRGRD